jgi:hypothetical protein
MAMTTYQAIRTLYIAHDLERYVRWLSTQAAE